jgi:hypothetical protein
LEGTFVARCRFVRTKGQTIQASTRGFA